MPEGNTSLKETAEAMQGVLKEISIYQDLAQPALQEAGKNLVVIGKAVKIALAPVTLLVWGYDTIASFLERKLENKLKNVLPENIITPNPTIVGPAIESLRFAGNDSTLSEMYANLIANAMDRETVKRAHPGFVEIIKNLTSDEAIILNILYPNLFKPVIDIKFKLPNEKGELNAYLNFSLVGKEAGIQHIDLTPNYINNLCRLGLIEIPPGRYIIDNSVYEEMEKSDIYIAISGALKNKGMETVTVKKHLVITDLGLQFKEACLLNKGGAT